MATAATIPMTTASTSRISMKLRALANADSASALLCAFCLSSRADNAFSASVHLRCTGRTSRIITRVASIAFAARYSSVARAMAGIAVASCSLIWFRSVFSWSLAYVANNAASLACAASYLAVCSLNLTISGSMSAGSVIKVSTRREARRSLTLLRISTTSPVDTLLTLTTWSRRSWICAMRRIPTTATATSSTRTNAKPRARRVPTFMLFKFIRVFPVTY